MNTKTRSSEVPRKGATRMADIPADVLADLNAGRRETATLAESLAIDFTALFGAAVPEAAGRLRFDAKDGVTKRMAAAGARALEALGPDAVERLGARPSDTVRGWACYALAAVPGLTLAERLQRGRPLAKDPHFGVREWAWLALRPHIAERIDDAVDLLAPWTGDGSERVRRFASEATRPRGVWCGHIGVLKEEPARGLAVLEPLRADPARYVQDSVANWLNDAAKTRPDWVRDLCARWEAESPVPATRYIVRRALRSVKAGVNP